MPGAMAKRSVAMPLAQRHPLSRVAFSPRGATNAEARPNIDG